MIDPGLHERLEDVEAQFGVGPTNVVLVFPGNERDNSWPEGIAPGDISIVRSQEKVGPEGEILEYEVPLVPHFRPPEFRGGIVILSKPEIARIYAAMPQDIRERERNHRQEQDEPIPPVIQN